jgi:outer membrane protein, adhesin transport system
LLRCVVSNQYGRWKNSVLKFSSWTHIKAPLLSVALLAGVTFAPASAESLRSVIQRALSQSPELGAIRNNRRAIDYELQAATGLSLPRLEADASLGVRGLFDAGDEDIKRARLGQENASVGVTLRQNLYDGGETRSIEQRQRRRVMSARSRVEDTANSIALRTVQAFLEVQRASRVVGIAKNNVAAHRSIVGRLRTRTELGGGVAVDETVALARLEATKAFLAEAEATHREATIMFRAITGFAPGKLDPVKAPMKSMPRSLEAAVAEAKRIAPSVVATLADTRAADSAVNTAKARLAPRIDAELGARARLGDYGDGGAQGEASAMIVMRHTLFDGGQNDARVEEAYARSQEARDNMISAKRIVEREVRFAWSAIQKGQARTTALSRQLSRNREAFAGYLDQFDLGERSLLDLLDIQNEIFILETNVVTEEFSARYSAFRVLGAMGNLVPALGIALPVEATWDDREPVDREIERISGGAIPRPILE